MDYLVAVTCTGFGVLFASVMATLFISSKIDWKRSIYKKEKVEHYCSIRFVSFFARLWNLWRIPSR